MHDDKYVITFDICSTSMYVRTCSVNIKMQYNDMFHIMLRVCISLILYVLHQNLQAILDS